MRVLQLIDALHVGGAETTAINYANLLVNHVDQSFICATRKEGPLKKTIDTQVNYLFLNKQSIIDYKAIKKLNKYLIDHQIDCIHAHGSSFFLATLVKLFNKKIIIVWQDHNGNRLALNKSHNIILRLCSYFFKSVIVVNENLKLWAEHNLKVKKVDCLYNFSVLKEKTQTTILNGNSGKRIVCLANLRYPKNHIFLLHVFRNISESIKGWSLHLVGEDFNDVYADELKQFVKNNNLEKHVFFYGLKQDIKNILSQCEIGVLTSTSEGLPLSIIEYGLAKLAVVCTDVGDCSKVVTKTEEGILVETNNLEQFSKALIRYLDNEILIKETGNNLYNNITTNFSAQSAIKQLVSIYKN